jgi:hypothetical protein
MTKSNPSSTEAPLTNWQIEKIKIAARQERRGIVPTPKTPKRRGPKPLYTKAERRRRHIKALLRERHPGSKLDQYIETLKERLSLLEELRNEREGRPNEQACDRQRGDGATED